MKTQHRIFAKIKAFYSDQESSIFLKMLLRALGGEDSLMDALSDIIYVVGIDTGEVDATILGEVDMLFLDQVFHLLGW